MTRRVTPTPDLPRQGGGRTPTALDVQPLPLDGGGVGVGVKSPAKFTALARALRKDMTEAERHLWRSLRMHHLDGHKFRRQFPLGPYIVDFICLPARLIVELDGGQHLDSPADKTRDAWLASQGFRVMRFWNNDVLNQTEAVLESILAALRPPHPHPNPPPSRGRERRDA